MMSMKVEKLNDNHLRLDIEGELTVENIENLHSKLCELQEEAQELTVHIGAQSTIDMTFAQTICAAHRAYTLQDKRLNVSGCLKELFLRTDEMGYTRQIGCELDKFNNCVLVRKEA
jgi:anti-anti-sigma regulatory factor